MGQIQKILPVKLIIGIIGSQDKFFALTQNALKKKFKTIDYISPLCNFDKTDYYQKEMGNNLKRRFLSFSKLIMPAELSKIKLYTNAIEKKYSPDNKRRVNIDPGYITPAKLVLATTKDYTHRIYIGKGIFAEATLYYKDETFCSYEWTYPDYKTTDYINAFSRIRQTYMGQLKDKKLL